MEKIFLEGRLMITTKNFLRLAKTQDTIITGLLGGFIGTLCMDISNTLLFKARKTEKLYGHLAGQFFVAPIRTKQRKNFILGELLHLSAGAIFGLPTIWMLKKTGKDHYLSKGLVTSILTWGILYSGGQKVGLFKKLRLTKTHYSAALNNVIYGLVSAKAMVMMADPNIFPSVKVSQSNSSIDQHEPQRFSTELPANCKEETFKHLH